MDGPSPVTFSAPGRVNLIGEHTDYNDGFVMPCAIGLRTRVTVSRLAEARLAMQSRQFPQSFACAWEELPGQATHAWYDYVLGIALALRQSDHAPPGASLLIDSDIPLGAGLSSSAAIEVAGALAMLSLTGAILPLVEVAKLCQRVENNFIGARVGIMDQFVSCLGKAGHALLLDCRSLEFQLIPIPPRVRMVVCNTMVKHAHAGGEYNRRREECEAGVKILAQYYPGIRALRDVTPAQVLEHGHDLPEKIFRRCRHVVEENARVRAGDGMLRGGDLHGFGDLMRQSHCSLRDLYEVSCHELDVMVESAEGLPGCYGARMTGGGFGGSTISLVEAAATEAFSLQISARYQKATGIEPEIYVCSPADGAGIEPQTL